MILLFLDYNDHKLILCIISEIINYRSTSSRHGVNEIMNYRDRNRVPSLQNEIKQVIDIF